MPVVMSDSKGSGRRGAQMQKMISESKVRKLQRAYDKYVYSMMRREKNPLSLLRFCEAVAQDPNHKAFACARLWLGTEQAEQLREERALAMAKLEAAKAKEQESETI